MGREAAGAGAAAEEGMTRTMSATEHLFCTQCGNLLWIAEREREARCSSCPFKRGVSEFLDVSIVSESGPRDWQKKYGVQPVIKENPELEKEVKHKRQVVDDDCPKCGHKGLEFYTLQLRSADEGQTVFYECPDCGHKFAQNT